MDSRRAFTVTPRICSCGTVGSWKVLPRFNDFLWRQFSFSPTNKKCRDRNTLRHDRFCAAKVCDKHFSLRPEWNRARHHQTVARGCIHNFGGGTRRTRKYSPSARWWKLEVRRAGRRLRTLTQERGVKATRIGAKPSGVLRLRGPGVGRAIERW